MHPQEFPLHWPADRPRTAPEARVTGRFKIPFEVAWDALVHEAEKLHEDKVREVIVSTNVPLGVDGLPLVSASGGSKIADPGVCVYVWREGKPYALASDHYREVRHNLRALWATVQALRIIARHATGPLLQQSMIGFCREIETETLRPVKMLAGNGLARLNAQVIANAEGR